jgi:uncharacterized repeat protein (TIGR01451 family)
MKSVALAILAGCAAACLSAGVTQAASAPAGVAIQNTAQVSYSLGGTTASTSSNTVSITVAEIVDVVTTLQSPTVSTSAGVSGVPMVFRVTNTGNAAQTFLLAATSTIGGDDFDPVLAATSIYLDTDGSGTLTAADTPYVPGTNDPVLAQDAFVTVFVVNNMPTGLATGARGFSRLTATSRTGSGAPGTVLAGKGPGGTDAVIGTTGGVGAATGTYVIGDVQLAVVKSAAVTDQFGGSRAIPGARIVYTVVVTPSGSGTASASVFTDWIPANTTYVAGSLKLNATALTDASDADAGAFLASPSPRVSVNLGALTAASGAQTLSFAVTIN